MDIMDSQKYEEQRAKVLARTGGKTDLHPDCANLVRGPAGKARCKIYTRRPKGCRAWPTHPGHIRNVPECGYRFIRT
jgi:Fe-S-cluster containining protein